jgi:hypothetical protein
LWKPIEDTNMANDAARGLRGAGFLATLFSRDKPASSNLIAKLQTTSTAVPKPSGGLARLLDDAAGKSANPQKPVMAVVAGRLGFVIDATASREWAWQEAKNIQGKMFKQASAHGRLALRMVHFRGQQIQTFPASGWLHDPERLITHMNKIECLQGLTQIVGSIQQLLRTAEPPTVIVLIGDCCEREDQETIEDLARVLGKLKIPVFAFFEGEDEVGRQAYKALARLSGGAFAAFGGKLALGSLIVAVGAYASGGEPALHKLSSSPDSEGKAAVVMMQQLRLAAPKR